ncbi:cytochrome ubiquinol oxidase subunit I, partial [bacterium]|nr:cytochrome ubiquinol oxidase subunit I [bacterium]
RGRRDRYHRLGLIIPFTVAAIAMPFQMGAGDSLARWVFNNQPMKFAAIELVPETSSDVPETILGRLNADGTVSGGIPIPGFASFLSDPGTGRSTVIQGLDSFPSDAIPTVRQVNTVHLAWDVMIGLGTLMFLVALWWGGTWLFRRDMPQSKLFLWVASSLGVVSVICMEAGWIVSEVGRQPWIVYELMTVEEAATENTGVWITFIGFVGVYTALAAATVYVLRRMSRRFRMESSDDHDTPYGPIEAAEISGATDKETSVGAP